MASTHFSLCRAVRSRNMSIVAALALQPALIALAILCCLLPVTAAAYVDYGFNTIDNSDGGSIMDNYITQELWADTDLRWTGTHLRLELESGSIFQDTAGGSGFITESNHDLLASAIDQPSLSFDTRVSLNGVAPVIYGGAINIEGSKEVQFTDTYLNVAYGHGGGEYHTGAFNFGTLTLSKDAAGQGAVMFSMHGEDEGGFYAQTFEIEDGVIRLTGERVNLEDPNYIYSQENWQFVRHEIPRRPPEPEPEPEPPSPAPPLVPSDPPIIELPPEIHPDPAPPIDLLPDPIADPIGEIEDPVFDPEEPVFTPGDPVNIDNPNDPGGDDEIIRFPIWRTPVVSEAVLIIDGLPVSIGGEEIWTGSFEMRPLRFLPFEITFGDMFLPSEANQADQGTLGSAAVLRSLDGTDSQFLTTAVMSNNGDLLISLSTISEAQTASLLATGYWTLQGENLLFSGPAVVPEPASIILFLLATGLAFRWRRRM